MNEKTLSKRLQLVASFLPKEARFADIGSDHAYLPCFVCLQDEHATAIAGELNEGPYQSAKKTVGDLQIDDRIEVRKGNGLSVIKPGEVEQVVIAGMGGSLISTILEEGKDKLLSVKRIITQPNVDADAIRKWFDQNDFQLTDEKIIEEDGHIYEILVGDRNSEYVAYTMENKRRELLFGPILLREKSTAFKQKWKIELDRKKHALKQMENAKTPNIERMNMFQEEIKEIEEVLENE
ncbi:tRNA (adenine(22)-N(1))-methyltransferase TrmK [Aquibacillus koreensis]|uniref:tRNA (Adenine(22)-N(1))-methyltransferase TrmK n=1 Tax=Aquibacillus koreensis TaxID=279446 RepID=A0A9X3WIK0_9BACI|nr:tRNA (adenine(22)-N(1))-methyltransferase TrmK [Aquibacillus koreensis]MCT2537585.1 tRNA (adenine(22)-N(1))-methyltransferase TrmK [Aquibacillus koreensis]MDC3419031.1 tRNA (adenine(22)-N(1))-methyltransferase TrmK [Aquibacillus koreensis]